MNYRKRNKPFEKIVIRSRDNHPSMVDELSKDFENLEDIYSINGSAMYLKLDSKLKDDEIAKYIRKELYKKNAEARIRLNLLFSVQARRSRSLQRHFTYSNN
jgi:hypothetical protein